MTSSFVLRALGASLPLVLLSPSFAQQAPAEAASPPPGSVADYYASDGERLWTGGRADRRRLRELIAVLDRMSFYGLDPEAYGLSELKDLARRGDADLTERAASRAFSSLALDIRGGRLDPMIDWTEEDVAQSEAERAELLEELARTGSVERVINALRRDNPIQERLARILERYRRYAEEDAWSPVELTSEIVEQGAKSPDVRKIRRRLMAEGFLREPIFGSGGDAYDEEVAAAVRAFQESRGIEPDGVVGPNTLLRMNETPSELVRRIELNLERARWLPQDFAERYLVVNIADFTVGAWEDDQLAFTIRTVVGDRYHKTPVFADAMEYVIANPYWNIPESILREDIAPKQAEDPAYFGRENLEVLSGWGEDAETIDPWTIDWEDLPETIDFRVRQKGGPENALGLIKFMFPNEYAVYLHDSPAESLFGEPERAFSHGCIRVAEPRKLARWVLEGTDLDEASSVDRLIEGGERERVDLARSIPVYVGYFTVWTDEDGSARFPDDVYDRDPQLAEALRLAAEGTGEDVTLLKD